jgi:hypothetical protein
MSDIENYIKEKKSENTPSAKEIKQQISQYLMSNFFQDSHNKAEQLVDWFNGYLKNYLYKENIDYTTHKFHDEMNHIIDYLNSEDCPKKFHAMTWDVLKQKIEKWDQWLRNRAERGDDPNNVAFLIELKNGWKAVDLQSRKALSYEGGVMKHCVGSYADRVLSGQKKIISLRDKQDNSHITIEFDTREQQIVQIQGKNNLVPKDEYKKYLAEFIQKTEMKLSVDVQQKLGYNRIGHQYFPSMNKNEFENQIREFMEKNKNYQDGGLLSIIENERPIHIQGVWDDVVLNNASKITFDNNFKAKKITVTGSQIKTIKGNVEKITIHNSMIDELFGNIKEIDINNMKTPQLNNIVCDINLSLNNATEFIPDPNRYYTYLELNEPIDVRFIQGEKLIINSHQNFINNELIYDPKKWSSLKVKDYPFDSVILKESDNGFLIVTGNNNIKKLKDDMENKNIHLDDASKLEIIENLKCKTLYIKNLKNLTQITKNNIKNATFIFNRENPQGITVRRNRIRKIKTNKVGLFKKVKNTYKP